MLLSVLRSDFRMQVMKTLINIMFLEYLLLLIVLIFELFRKFADLKK